MSATGNPSSSSLPSRYSRVRAWHLVGVTRQMAEAATVSGSRPRKVRVSSGRDSSAPLDAPSASSGSPGSRCGEFIASSLGAVTVALTLRGQPSGRTGSVLCVIDVTWLDATAQAGLVRRGEISPKDLVEAAIGRIEALNPGLDAVIRTRFGQARADAGDALPDGPFRG